jgi:phosphoribosylformylglycinamidine cyclo-ligase
MDVVSAASCGSVDAVSSDYSSSGVRGQGEALSAVERHLTGTLKLPWGRLLTRFGHYATVVEIEPDSRAMAITTDGVGSKTLIASAMDKYDTIGFDCVAMNVNDILCVGARPYVLVDYLGVHTLDERRTDEILKGLAAAAIEARVAIPGGELAQLPEVIGSDGNVPGDETAFDLVGTCVGFMHPKELVLGQDVQPGDVMLALHSSGIHSNGLTLARRVLLKEGGYALDTYVEKLGCTVGDELLRPTEIYVRAIDRLWSEGVATHGLVHITGDGFANLARLDADVGYSIDALPPIPEIFRLIQATGDIDDAEMYRVFNMGVGMVVIVSKDDAERARAVLKDGNVGVTNIGIVVEEPGITIEPPRLRGVMEDGESVFRSY